MGKDLPVPMFSKLVGSVLPVRFCDKISSVRGRCTPNRAAWKSHGISNEIWIRKKKRGFDTRVGNRGSVAGFPQKKYAFSGFPQIFFIFPWLQNGAFQFHIFCIFPGFPGLFVLFRLSAKSIPGPLTWIELSDNIWIDSLKDTCYAWGKYSTSGYFGR